MPSAPAVPAAERTTVPAAFFSSTVSAVPGAATPANTASAFCWNSMWSPYTLYSLVSAGAASAGTAVPNSSAAHRIRESSQ